MNRLFVCCIAAVSLAAPTTVLQAEELKLAAVFADHMVLQRDKAVPVWGWAEPGSQITIQFADQSKTATAADDGKWSAKLEPMPASAAARTLVAASKGAKAEITDVLVGEVWLGSGQSNMAMTVSRAKNFDAEKADADLPLIRMFRESSGAAENPQADAKGSWDVCSAETVGSFSATLYFFGRELHRELDVPVGLINSSVGGTPIESWVAANAQAAVPELKDSYGAAMKAWREFDEPKVRAQYERALEQWKQRVAKAKSDGKPTPARPRSPIDTRNRRGGPGGLFNGKIAPLVPYAIRGAVWYQGEANSQPGKGHLYQYQLSALISDWREQWGDDFPFAWVQLPNFRRDGNGWMLVREGMLKTLRLPNTGMAITIDIGEATDIHPKNKQDVGKRLAMWALGDVYGKEHIAVSGPIADKHEVRNGEIVITFAHANEGLHVKGDKLEGFVIAGKDQQWKPAAARIEENQVIVSHPTVNQPVAVRYAWAADPACNLYNGQGLPASPFRTDNWESSSVSRAVFGRARWLHNSRRNTQVAQFTSEVLSCVASIFGTPFLSSRSS